MPTTARQPRVGLLPFYIELYDRSTPEMRPRIDAFAAQIADALTARGTQVVSAPVCRLAAEFSAAVAQLEQAQVDCIVTLHLAYSPSLESIDALAATPLPLIVLDTTETFRFNHPREILYNHGIHGVMDFCNLLHQRNKPFAIAAGHWEASPVLDRVVAMARAAMAAGALRGLRVARLGGSFAGMGDFAVEPAALKARFGLEAINLDGASLAACRAAVSDEEVAAEVAADLAGGVLLNGDIDPVVHARSARDCLALRHCLAQNDVGAFTVNFTQIVHGCGLETMPFMEACRGMARGLGYAGEGDILTAAFCGAMMQGFPSTSFIEIFCPDWAENRLMLSHMGEMNYALADGAPELTELNFVYGDAKNPVVGYTRLRAGQAVFANVYPDGRDFGLLLAPVTMEAPAGEDCFVGNMRGWMRPALPLPRFLEGLSEAGATHHSLLVYDAPIDALAYFGRLCGMSVTVLQN